MTLYVRTGRRSMSSGWNYGEASRVDRLRADGWEDCEYEECNGSGIAAHFCEESRDRCARGEHPECSNCQGLGLVPPDGMVYAATRKVFRGVMPAGFQIERVRAGLVAAARWEALAGGEQP